MSQNSNDRQEGDFGDRFSFRNRAGAARIGKNRFGNHSVGDIERNTLPEEAFEVHNDPISGAPQMYASILNLADRIQENIESGKAASAYAAQNTPQAQQFVGHLLAVARQEEGTDHEEESNPQESAPVPNFSALQAALSQENGIRFGIVTAAGMARTFSHFAEDEEDADEDSEGGEEDDDLPLDVEDDGGTITDEMLRAEEAALEQLRAEIRGHQARQQQQQALAPPISTGVPMPPNYNGLKKQAAVTPHTELMRLCVHCNTVNSPTHKFCVECGSDIRPKTCINCCKAFVGTEKFCGECGTRRT